MYLKRQAVRIFWPIPRKGKKYLAVATHEASRGIPLVVVMRDILNFVKNKKELKKLINDKKILINRKVIRKINYPVLLFDSISFPSIKKNYRAVLKNKKVGFKEIEENEASTRIYKIISKKRLKGGKMQINLSSGKNILSSEKARVGDFAVLNVFENKIIRMIALQKGTNVAVVSGKHIGVYGKIKGIKSEGQNKIAEIISDKGEGIEVDTKNLFAVGDKQR